MTPPKSIGRGWAVFMTKEISILISLKNGSTSANRSEGKTKYTVCFAFIFEKYTIGQLGPCIFVISLRHKIPRVYIIEMTLKTHNSLNYFVKSIGRGWAVFKKKGISILISLKNGSTSANRSEGKTKYTMCFAFIFEK